MSLIDEALKRARQEATRQDAEARELRYRQVPVIPGLRQRPRRSWMLPVVIAACLTAGVGIGLGLSLSRNSGEDVKAAALPPAISASTAAPVSQPVVQETQEAPPPPVVEEAEQPPAIVEKEESPAPVAPKPAAPPAPEPVPQEEPRIADMRTREISLTPAASAPVPSVPAVAEPSAPAPTSTAPGEVRTYQQEMPLPGGGALRLNGIAFSERPVALFGDKVVAPGETVSGYKVISIEARRVRLEGAGGTVVVELQ
jgi:hypothetical protein